MFSTSIGLLLGHLAAYIILPLIPGIIAARIIIDDRLRGWLFYLISWFIGVGVLSSGLFLLQFLRFGIDRLAYAILIVAFAVLLIIRVAVTRIKRKMLRKTLRISCKCDGRKGRNKRHKTRTILLALYILIFAAITFFFVTQLPSYADDSFGNWHMPVMNILYDGGVHIFWQVGEILGRGRLGYPIMIPTMQAFISGALGGYNDIYINLFPWLSTMLFCLFIGIYVYKKKQNFLLSLIGPALIISLPLIFTHTTQGYMDLLSALYTAIAVIAFYEWLHEGASRDDFLLGITMLCIVSTIKNDGFVVYMAGILIALVIYFLIFRKNVKERFAMFKRPSTRVNIVVLVLFFIVPFAFLKSYYNLGYNQAAGADAGLGLASVIHREIFPAIWKTIWSMNNFSLAPLLMFVVAVYMLVFHKKVKKEQRFLLLSPVVVCAIFIAVFLMTENYKFVLDQTTVNRVFTMVLVIFCSYIPLMTEPQEN